MGSLIFGWLVATTAVLLSNTAAGDTRVQSSASGTSSATAPNIILFVADDMGYSDISSYGSPTINTPNIDKIGEDGVKFTQFYVAASICTPSRAAMLTGRLPIRSGVYSDLDFPFDSIFRVFYPTSVGCMPESEVTIGDALGPSGYSTAMIGKWHLGHNPDARCLPGNGNAGFDFFYGLPYSHEEGYPGPMPEGLVFPPVPLMTNGYKFVEQPYNGSDLTSRYTSLAERMIDRFAAEQKRRSATDGTFQYKAGETDLFETPPAFFTKPFFLHVGYENPHVPLFLSADYDPVSLRGLYGDSVEEMDASIGRIVQALERGGLIENTIIIFMSDNGAWVNPNNGLNSNRETKGMGPFDGGCNAPFFEGKGSTWEGGFRVPFLVSWPAKIPNRQIIRFPVTAMDIFPTLLEATGTAPPDGVTLDGVSLLPLLTNGGGSSMDVTPPHECIYFWREHSLYAIRCGQYKAHYITRSGFDFKEAPETHDPPLLFNVDWDPAEAIGLDTSTKESQAVLSYLNAQAAAHVRGMQVGVSQYLAQNYSRVPCCPRDSVSTDGTAGGIFVPLNPASATHKSLTNDIVEAYGRDVKPEVLAAVEILGTAAIDIAGHEGPWRDCLCRRPEFEVSPSLGEV